MTKTINTEKNTLSREDNLSDTSYTSNYAP